MKSMIPPVFARVLPAVFCLAIPARAEDPTFSRDVRPILSDMCFKCHGPDDKGRKGKLLLSERDAALKGGKSGDPAIVPGKPSESEIIRRLHSDDPEEQMPPPSMKKSLTPEQISVLEKWIAAGAKYEKHWAFEAPVSPAVPKSQASHPIDAFVQTTLAGAGLKPSAEADKAAAAKLRADLAAREATIGEEMARLLSLRKAATDASSTAASAASAAEAVDPSDGDESDGLQAPLDSRFHGRADARPSRPPPPAAVVSPPPPPPPVSAASIRFDPVSAASTLAFTSAPNCEYSRPSESCSRGTGIGSVPAAICLKSVILKYPLTKKKSAFPCPMVPVVTR